MSHEHELHDAYGNHVSPVSTYLKVFGALLVLTVVTVAISYMGLGEASFPIAMIVASTKATIVAAYFMHLKYEDKLYTFVLLASVLFVGLYFSFTYMDLFTRDHLEVREGNYYYQQDKAWEDGILEGTITPSAAPEAPAAGTEMPAEPATP